MAFLTPLSLAGAEGTFPAEYIIFGRAKAMRAVWQKVETVAKTNIPVLVRGESGTGKEVLARLIHRRSPWAQGPFIKLNCAAIPRTMRLEGGLLGEKEGFLPGAFGVRFGGVDMAHRGTLLMDEIGELAPTLQLKLLQWLPDGQFTPIDGDGEKPVGSRIVFTTTRDLEKEVRAGTFRSDLFYCINVVNMYLPPLRERVEDIPQLVDYFLALYQKQYCSQACIPSALLMQLLRQHHWPGNIRELENLIHRYVILGSEEAIIRELTGRGRIDLEPEVPVQGTVALKKLSRQAVCDREREAILKVLQGHHGNRRQAARALGISYRALLYKLKEAGVPPKRAPLAQSLPRCHPGGIATKEETNDVEGVPSQ